MKKKRVFYIWSCEGWGNYSNKVILEYMTYPRKRNWEKPVRIRVTIEEVSNEKTGS
mgnify:CR=1 FL=1